MCEFMCAQFLHLNCLDEDEEQSCSSRIHFLLMCCIKINTLHVSAFVIIQCSLDLSVLDLKEKSLKLEILFKCFATPVCLSLRLSLSVLSLSPLLSLAISLSQSVSFSLALANFTDHKISYFIARQLAFARSRMEWKLLGAVSNVEYDHDR